MNQFDKFAIQLFASRVAAHIVCKSFPLIQGFSVVLYAHKIKLKQDKN